MHLRVSLVRTIQSSAACRFTATRSELNLKKKFAEIRVMVFEFSEKIV